MTSRTLLSKAAMVNVIRVLVSGVSMVIVMTCSVMDDSSIPKDQFSLVEISDFEVDMARGYFRGRIQNNSHYEMSSAILEFDLYSQDTVASSNSNFGKLNPVRRYSGSDSPPNATRLLSKKFLIREPLKPGYSTEIYFELKMDYDSGDFLYTYKVVDLKGRYNH